MPHGGDDRRLTVVDRPGHPFVIKGPQVLHRPAPPAGDDHVADLPPVRVPAGSGDLRRGLGPLDTDRQQNHLRQGIAPVQNADHIVDCRPCGGCDDGDCLRIRWKGLFVGGIEEALRIEAGLQLFEGHRQIPRPLRRQSVAVELVGSVSGKDRHTARGDGSHAVFRTEPEL